MDDFGFLVVMVLVAYLTLIMIFMKPRKQKQVSATIETPKSKSNKVTPDDLMKVLDFMRERNVIDHKQYNELVVKAMPHV